MKYHTSKITSFQDVSSAQTLGFRGEALSSLCGVVSKFSVITTIEPPRADALEYARDGSLVTRSTATRNKGSTFQVHKLFDTLPVRRKEFERTVKRQFTKCINLLQSYAIIQENIKFTVWNISSKGRKSSVLTTTGHQSIPKKIISIFGSNAMHGLSHIDIVVDLNPFKDRIMKRYLDDPTFENIDYKIRLVGYISKISFGCGRSSKDRQFFYINKRPIQYQQLAKCCNDVYRLFNNVQNPAIFLNLEVSPSLVDVNVTPDKRTVLLHNEKLVMDLIKTSLTEYFNAEDFSLPKRSATVMKTTIPPKRIKTETEYSSSQELLNAFQEDVKRQVTISKDAIPYEVSIMDKTNIRDQRLEESDEKEVGVQTTLAIELRGDGEHEPTNTDEQWTDNPHRSPSLTVSEEYVDNNAADSLERPLESLEGTASLNDDIVKVTIANERSEQELVREEGNLVGLVADEVANKDDVSTNDEEIDDVFLDEPTVKQELNVCSSSMGNSSDKIRLLSDYKPSNNTRLYSLKRNLRLPSLKRLISTGIDIRGKLDSENSLLAEDGISSFEDKNSELLEDSLQHLTLTVKKPDFKKMVIIGQFNLGFIVVTRKLDNKYDLFIVDQHASDEKYNFEMLQKETVFNSQRLIAPQPMDLSIIDELVVIDNKQVFEKNGFKLSIDEDAAQGRKIKLLSLPVSKKTVFGLDDFDELIHLVKENNTSDNGTIRCSKIRSMFAMRACRSSIMIGKPLTTKIMTRVVHHLGDLDKPWNCPHGRPTMRHLAELGNWTSFTDDYSL